MTSFFSLPTGSRLCLSILACCALQSVDAEMPEVAGTGGDDRLVGTPGTDYFRGGPGADVFVINYLSVEPDVIEDFDPDEGDTIELTFESDKRQPLQQENLSIDRKGVVKINFGNRQQDVVRLNRSDLSLKLDPRKGRYVLRFSKKF